MLIFWKMWFPSGCGFFTLYLSVSTEHRNFTKAFLFWKILYLAQGSLVISVCQPLGGVSENLGTVSTKWNFSVSSLLQQYVGITSLYISLLERVNWVLFRPLWNHKEHKSCCTGYQHPSFVFHPPATQLLQWELIKQKLFFKFATWASCLP